MIQHLARTSNEGTREHEEARGDTARMIPPLRAERLQSRISGIGWLSTSIIHDLRNPLGAVFTSAEMLMEIDPASTQGKRLAANIYRAAGRMRELLTELAGASCGNESTSEICKIRDVITAASVAAIPAAETQSVQILHDVPDNLETRLERYGMERVFFNLITNALEAMPRGGKIRIGARKTGKYVLIDVEDTGPGIPSGIRDRLFQPFVTAGKEHGLGLGLALSRQTLLNHGGDMWIEPADGARFVMCLPVNQSLVGFQIAHRDPGFASARQEATSDQGRTCV